MPRTSPYTLLLWLGATAVLAAAVFLRVFNLDNLPPGLHGDEAVHGLEAIRIWNDGWIGIWSPVALGQPAGPLYFFALFVNMAPHEVWSARLGSAVIGIATIPAFFMFCRRLLDTPAALIGAALLGLGIWHVHFSRIAYPLIALPLVELLSLWVLMEAFVPHRKERTRLVLFALAGAGLGVTPYAYSVFYVFIAVMALFWVREIAFGGHDLRRVLTWLGVYAAAALILALPFIIFASGHWSQLRERRQVASITRMEEYTALEGVPAQSRFVIRRTADVFLNLYVTHPTDGADGAGGKPLLDPLTGALAGLGLLAAVLRIRDRRGWLLFTGIAAGAAGTSFFLDGENRRFLAAMPFVFAAAGYGGKLVAGAMRGRTAMPVAAGLAVAALAFVAWWNVSVYYRDYTPSQEHRWVFATELVQFARQYEAFEEKPYVYFYSDRWGLQYETLQYLAPDMRGEDRSVRFGTFAIERGRQFRNVMWVVMPPYEGVLETARDWYPGGELHEVRHEGQFIYGTYHLR